MSPRSLRTALVLRIMMLVVMILSVNCATRWMFATNCTIQVQLAKTYLEKNGIDHGNRDVMRDRLLVPILHTHSTNVSELDMDGLRYHKALQRSVTTLVNHLAITTPLDIFIFMRVKHIARPPRWLADMILTLQEDRNVTLELLPLNDAAFQMPHNLLRPRDMSW